MRRIFQTIAAREMNDLYATYNANLNIGHSRILFLNPWIHATLPERIVESFLKLIFQILKNIITGRVNFISVS